MSKHLNKNDWAPFKTYADKLDVTYSQWILILLLQMYFIGRQNLIHLIFLSTSHNVEEKIYTALVHDGHAFQKSYFI